MRIRALMSFFSQTHATAAAALKTWRESLTSRSECKTVIETGGTEFIIYRKGITAGAIGVASSAVYPLGPMKLGKALKEIDYIGEPISIILHPPCVCMKSFSPAVKNPDKWLASHLAEIVPPGNRRELVMCYRRWNLDHLLVAFVRRSFLTTLRDLLQQSRASVQGIYVGGSVAANSLTQGTHEPPDHSIAFSLCTYEITRNGDGGQVLPHPQASQTDILPSSLVKIPSPSHRPLESACPTEEKVPGRLSNLVAVSLPASAQGEDIDFREQIGFPKILSSGVVLRMVHAECVLILILVGIMLLRWGMLTITGGRSSTEDYLLAERSLVELQRENDNIAGELELATRLQEPRYNTSAFLKSVALATPPQAWLTSISYGTAASNTDPVFRLNGFGLNGDEPLCLADSLRKRRGMRSVALTKASIVENPEPVRKHKLFQGHLTKFEIAGTYARK